MSSTITGSATGIVSPNTAAPNLTTPPQATVPSNGDSPDATVIVADVQVALNYIAYLQSKFIAEIYGDGSDGVCTFNGSASVPGATLSGGTYTLTRDIQASIITVTGASTAINVAGFELLAQQSISINSAKVYGLGASAVFGIGGASATGPHASRGRNSASAGYTPAQTFYAVCGLGGNGGYGGSYSTYPQINGTIALLPLSSDWAKPPYRYGVIPTETYLPPGATVDVLRGGAGGSGGQGDGTNAGGGGGEAGQLVVLRAPVIALSNEPIFDASGGAGAAGTGGNAAGGGGGGGGAFHFICGALTITGTAPIYTANGGAAGAGVGTGHAGGTGGAGNTTPYVVYVP